MNKKIASGIILQSVIITVFLSLFPQGTASAVLQQPVKTIDPRSQELILSATIQISIFAQGVGEEQQEAAANQGSVIEAIYERGLGTLVDLSGEIMIVTHNHWEFFDSISKVQFRNAQGELLMEIDEPTFRELVRYYDAGTLVLAAPAKISPSYLEYLASRSLIKAEQVTKAVSLGDVSALSAGAQVLIPHQSRENPNRISVTAAVIESVTTVEGLPALKLRSLDGELIIKGDSGGGIWLEGQLVGNMWKSEVVSGLRSWITSLFNSKGAHEYTSYAALLPARYQGLVNAEASSEVAVRASGLSE